MELLIGIIIFFIIIGYKTYHIFKYDIFEESKTNNYKIILKYLDKDFLTEDAIKDFKIMK